MNKYPVAKKMISYIVIFLFFLQACSVPSNKKDAGEIGPQSSAYESKKDAPLPVLLPLPKLDVIIPIFDSGLSEDVENYEEEGIWPELRRAEANRFAYKLKQALDNSKAFGAVRVTPNKTTSGDLYIIGKIEESNGQDVEIGLKVVDISGKEWLNDSFDHEVDESFYKSSRNKGQDAYAPVFKEAVDEIIEALTEHSASQLDNLKYLANLQFGASFNDEAFSEHKTTEDGVIKIVSKPSDSDPLLQRVMAIRVREQLFVDNLQQNYASFSQNMDNSYLTWQEASFTERELRSGAQWKSGLKIAGGVVLFALAITAIVAGASSGVDLASTASSAISGGVVGGALIASGFKSAEEAEFHKDALNELSGSINEEMSPQVISFENESVELTGNLHQQFTQWREFLKRIYEQESTPSTQL